MATACREFAEEVHGVAGLDACNRGGQMATFLLEKGKLMGPFGSTARHEAYAFALEPGEIDDLLDSFQPSTECTEAELAPVHSQVPWRRLV